MQDESDGIDEREHVDTSVDGGSKLRRGAVGFCSDGLLGTPLGTVRVAVGGV